MNKEIFREKKYFKDIIIVVLIITAGLLVYTNPIDKSQPAEKINLSGQIPAHWTDWKSVSYPTENYHDQWQSINELLVRTYYNRFGRRFNLIVEYGSDLRKNFAFHFPENCHRAGGNEVEFLAPLVIPLEQDKKIIAKLVYIKGVKGAAVDQDTLVAYWLVIDGKYYYNTFWIKLDQMLSGILANPKKGLLVRVDYNQYLEYSSEKINHAKDIITDFVQRLYIQFDSKERLLFFPDEKGRNLWN